MGTARRRFLLRSRDRQFRSGTAEDCAFDRVEVAGIPDGGIQPLESRPVLRAGRGQRRHQQREIRTDYDRSASAAG